MTPSLLSPLRLPVPPSRLNSKVYNTPRWHSSLRRRLYAVRGSPSRSTRTFSRPEWF